MILTRPRLLAIATAFLLLGTTGSTQAAFVITINNQTLSAGASSLVDVFIQSDQTRGDVLSLDQLQFQITRTAGTGQVQFGTPNFTTLASDPTYVFAKYSTKPKGSPATTTLPSDTFNVGDFIPTAADGTYPSVIVTGPLLLTRLLVVAGTDTQKPGVGSKFAITLNLNPNLTFFQDADFNSTAFQSTPGIITITPAAAVPEPNSACLILTGLSASFLVRRRFATRRISPNGSICR